MSDIYQVTRQSDFDFSGRSVIPYAHDYRHGDYEDWHTHSCAQLIHTLSGVIRIETRLGLWVVPPSRGVWIPANIPHALHITGDVKARVLFVEPLARADLPVICQVVGVSDLLRELIICALTLPADYTPGSRAERVYELIVAQNIGVSVPVLYKWKEDPIDDNRAWLQNTRNGRNEAASGDWLHHPRKPAACRPGRVLQTSNDRSRRSESARRHRRDGTEAAGS